MLEKELAFWGWFYQIGINIFHLVPYASEEADII